MQLLPIPISFALQFAVVAGATVIATSSSDEKLKVATRLGAKHVINYKTTPAWDKEVLRLTNGRGVDRVIEVNIRQAVEVCTLLIAATRSLGTSR